MTITVYEFDSVDPRSGEPVHPASRVRSALALDTDHSTLKSAVVVQVVPAVAVRLGVGRAPGVGDYMVPADALATMVVGQLSAPTIRATAA